MARRAPEDAPELFIDLGVLPGEEPAEDGGPALPHGPFRWSRRIAVALAVAAVLGGVTAAVPDPRPRLSALAVLDGKGTQVQVLDDELVVVLGPDGATAYETAGWRQRWQVAATDLVHAAAFGDVVLLRSGGSENGGWLGWPAGQTTAVDRTTGQTLWRTQRYVEPAGDLLVSYSPEGSQPDVEIRDPRRYDLRWRLPASRVWVYDVRRDAVWRLAADGAVVEHDLHTGAVRRTLRPRLPAAKYVNIVLSREAVGFEGYEDNGRPEQRGVLWYDAKTFAQVTGARQWVWESDCGGGLSCAYTAGDGRAFLIDPVTGEPVRSLPEEEFVPSPAGLLLVGSPDLGFITRRVLARLEPATGRRLTDLAGWHALSDDGTPVRVLGRTGARQGTTYLTELAEDGPHRLGEVPYLLRSCGLAGAALVCTTMSGDIAVWGIGRERP
ncbi:hypothetical protein [Catellatospora bangladeshensis]|uniref:Uncharacterized protein n=1 Tax=Catellatospora bangladeshensis TaxID=310355 RepID=A0A8J3JIK0_9ACTN|nr:hypothetical protein [Catellatospora bangladeshensis]GIF79650.1 hypothetical protein Cba03nite_09990 [Catellatospora bangladeshensis]